MPSALLWAFAIIIMISFAAWIAVSTIVYSECHSACDSKGAMYSQAEANGEFNLNDFCTCFYADRTETFRLGER